MKKVLVLSDTHSNFNKVLKIFEIERPDIVIAAGDGIKDIDELSYVHSDVKYFTVKGNCDFFDRSHSEENLFEIEKVKIFLTHGHLYEVKRTLDTIKEVGRQLKASLVIYGHTHRAYLEENKDVTLFNPGAGEDGKYGIILIDKNNIQIFHKQL